VLLARLPKAAPAQRQSAGEADRPPKQPAALNRAQAAEPPAQASEDPAPDAQAIPGLSKPHLVASEDLPFGNVVQIVSGLLEPGSARSKVNVVVLYKAYAAACSAAGKRPIAPAGFPEALAPICTACGTTLRDGGAAGLFLPKAKLRQAGSKDRLSGRGSV
jgi:hypothetical protein